MSIELEDAPRVSQETPGACLASISRPAGDAAVAEAEPGLPRIRVYAVARAARLQVERGAIWGILAIVSAQGVTTLTNLIVARRLGNQDFGQFCTVQNTAVTVGNFACAGLGFSATRFVAGWRSQNPEKIAGVIRMLRMASFLSGVFFSLCVLVLAKWVAVAIFHAPSLEWMIRLISLSITFLSISAFQQGVLLGFSAFREMAIAGVAHMLTGLCIAALLVHHSLAGSVIAFLSISASSVGWQEVMLQRKSRQHLAHLPASERLPWSGILASCAVPSALAGVVSQAAFWIATAIVANGKNGFTQVALFSAAFTLRQGVAFLPSIFSRIAGPILYDFSLSIQDFRRSLLQTAAASGFVAVSAAVPLCLLAPWVLSLFGTGFSPAVPAARLLIMSGVIESVAMTLYHSIVRKDAFWAYLAVIILWGTCIVVAAASGSLGFGATALASGYVVAWFLACLGICGIGLIRTA